MDYGCFYTKIVFSFLSYHWNLNFHYPINPLKLFSAHEIISSFTLVPLVWTVCIAKYSPLSNVEILLSFDFSSLF